MFVNLKLRLFVLAALVLTNTGQAKERDPGHIAAGYKAGFMCSGVFTAGISMPT